MRIFGNFEIAYKQSRISATSKPNGLFESKQTHGETKKEENF
jgi:hypothetical protein